jgi:MFS family permease
VAVSVSLLAVTVAYLRRRFDAYLDLSVLRVRTFAQSLRGMVPFTMVVGSVPLMLPLMFEDRFGWSPVKSGTLVLFVFLGNIVAKPATTPLLNRYGYRSVLFGATASVALTMAAFAVVDRSTPWAVVAAVAFLNGCVRSVGYSGFLTLVYSDVTEAQMAHGTTLTATAQQVAAGFAASVGVVALRLGSSISHTSALHSQATYRAAFLLLAALAIVPVLNALSLHRNAGDALRTRRVGH